MDEVVTQPQGSYGKKYVERHADHLPSSQEKFAWNADRIAHELVVKFDRFTRCEEDKMRKLVWTFGTDPNFENPDPAASNVIVTPENFPKVCDRFGLVCSQHHAREIFQRHDMPMEGCNMYTMARNFLDGKVETAQLMRDHSRRMLGDERPPVPKTPIPRRDPYKLARLPGATWAAHHAAADARAGTPGLAPAAGMPSTPGGRRLEPLTLA